jgi:hypothetical protein
MQAATITTGTTTNVPPTHVWRRVGALAVGLGLTAGAFAVGRTTASEPHDRTVVEAPSAFDQCRLGRPC